MTNTIYTIGHSTHPIERFVALLCKHQITAVCDVRSRPYSRVNPQFNREPLKEVLSGVSIKYVFLGKELGARSEDRSCYRNGQAHYELIAQTELFGAGIGRVEDGAQSYRIALMCAEKEPLDCHRTILVSRRLREDGFIVKHILANGEAEDHDHAIERLIAMLRIPTSDMFLSHSEAVSDAYTRRGSQIAYREHAPHEEETHRYREASE